MARIYRIISKNSTPAESPSASTLQPRSLVLHLGTIRDPRVNRTRRHNLLDILVIGVCTLLCGGETFNDMEDFGYAKEAWLRTFLELPNGIPSHDTFNRVFAALNLLKPETTQKRGIRGKQKNAGWNHACLLRLLGVTAASPGSVI